MTTLSVTKPATAKPAAPASPRNEKLWKNAKDFEAQFLKSMLEQAFSGLSGEGPLGGSGIGASAWRGFLIDEHAKAVAGGKGIGIAATVYRQLQARMAGGTDVRA